MAQLFFGPVSARTAAALSDRRIHVHNTSEWCGTCPPIRGPRSLNLVDANPTVTIARRQSVRHCDMSGAGRRTYPRDTGTTIAGRQESG